MIGQHTLSIEISGLKNNNGQVLLEFADGNGKKISGHFQKIENKKCTIMIQGLKPGKYSFKYFHDENNNEKLDTNFLGIPKEGFGFSNNAKGSFGPPSLNKMIFNINENTTQSCKATYF